MGRLGEPLNAVISVIAAPARAESGPLADAPVAVKDNVDVAGVVTTNASEAGVPGPAAGDAELVRRLRAAGAEVFCKTNLLEYAAGSVHPGYGMTYNPRDPGRTSGGSSSGSAALVAAGVCDHAVGTDTGGSIRIPASYCGIVGLKPSFGAVPLDGVFPLAESLDHAGTLTRSCRQAAAMFAVMAGRPCPIEPAPAGRVGVLRRQLEDADLREDVRERVEAALEALATLGFELLDVDVPELDLADDALGTIVVYEAWAVHRGTYEREASRYGEGTRMLLEMGREVDEQTYLGARIDMRRVGEGFERVLAEVDVLAGPTVAYPAPAEDPPVGTPQGDVEARFTAPYNLAGLPAVSVPCGTVEEGLPVGLQLAAARDAEPLLLSVAAAYEERDR
jgi:aspartyl-tRNA(Asn)/glutamyl-tRNA(Gln) amidotransferase subunit A